MMCPPFHQIGRRPNERQDHRGTAHGVLVHCLGRAGSAHAKEEASRNCANDCEPGRRDRSKAPQLPISDGRSVSATVQQLVLGIDQEHHHPFQPSLAVCVACVAAAKRSVHPLRIHSFCRHVNNSIHESAFFDPRSGPSSCKQELSVLRRCCPQPERTWRQCCPCFLRQWGPASDVCILSF